MKRSEDSRRPVRYAEAGAPAGDAQARTLALNLVLEADLRLLVRALGERGIDVVVLKGIPLALRLFGSIAARAMIDNDLLVRRSEVFRARDVLAEHGYESIDCRRIETQLAFDYQYRMAKRLPGEGFLSAELHWHAFSQLLYPVSEEVLWAHVEPFTWDGLTVEVFDPPLTVVHLAAHLAQSDFAVPQILRDIAAAWNLFYAHAEPDDVLELGRETGLIHALDFALLSVADLGLLNAPPPVIGSRRAARLRRLLPAERLCEPRPIRDYQRRLLGLLLVEPRRVPGWLRYAVFPPLENLAAIEGSPASPVLRWRHLIRPWHVLGRALSRSRERFVRG
ncbi:MAG: nucleotidyltransferase family protein [Candidatus Binatia bacterium]